MQNRKKTFIEDILQIHLADNIKYDLSCFSLSRDMIKTVNRIKSHSEVSFGGKTHRLDLSNCF